MEPLPAETLSNIFWDLVPKFREESYSCSLAFHFLHRLCSPIGYMSRPGPKTGGSRIVSKDFKKLLSFFFYVMHLNCDHCALYHGCSELQLAFLNRLILILLNGNLFLANTNHTVTTHARTWKNMCQQGSRQASPCVIPQRRCTHTQKQTNMCTLHNERTIIACQAF